MRTYIYIDGFNFYYTAVKGTPYKWLDFMALFSKVLGSKNEILKIKYFTALVSANNDPQRPIRQQSYIRALEAYTPQFEKYYGHFMTHEKEMPLADPMEHRRKVKVIKTEEKGSDVNLAIHLLNDAWLDKYDCALVVSNDSDLQEAVRLVREERKKCIGFVKFQNPANESYRPSKELLSVVTFIKNIKMSTLKSCQLPDNIPNTRLHRPSTW